MSRIWLEPVTRLFPLLEAMLVQQIREPLLILTLGIWVFPTIPLGQLPEVTIMLRAVPDLPYANLGALLLRTVETLVLRLEASPGSMILALGLLKWVPNLTIPGLLVAVTRLVHRTLANGAFLLVTFLMAGCMTALTVLLTMDRGTRGIGSQVFTLLAPGFLLLLRVCPRLRETGTG